MAIEFNEKELKSIRATFCPGFTDDQFEVCMTFCKVRNLLPGKHVIFQLRSSKEWDEAARAKVPVTKIIFITTIDASRLIAQRTGQYGGQGPEEYIYLDENGAPKEVSDIPLAKLPLPPNGATPLPREPWAVRTTVYRKDFTQPVSSIARFDAYAATYNTANGTQLSEMWARRGPEQLAKCSEMLSLRKAFPEELGGLYISEEFKPDQEDIVNHPTSPAVAVPVPPPAPAVNQTTAEGTNTPRPGEKTWDTPSGGKVTETQVKANEVKVEYHANTVPAILPEHSGETLKVTGHISGPETVPTQAKPVVQEQANPASEPDKKPAPKKRGPKPKPNPVDQGITDEDTAILDGQPRPEVPGVDPEVNKQEAKAFVEEAMSFTKEEAVAQGLPEPVDPVPGKEQLAGFVARSRSLVGAGVDIKAIGDYTLTLGNKASAKALTVGDWTKALTNLETAKAEGKLKELVSGTEVPLGKF